MNEDEEVVDAELLGDDKSGPEGLIYFGDEKSFEGLKETLKLEDSSDDDEPKEEKKAKVSTKTILSIATEKQVDEERMKILKRTRCVHDYNEVFMQSNADFYDEYYNSSEEVSPELKAARNIRRSYRSYPKYLEALQVYYAYIDSLVDKYGERDFINKVHNGLIREWIPPLPRLSKSAEGYELYEAGLLPVSSPKLSDEEIKDFLQKWAEENQDLEVELRGGMETSTWIIHELEENENSPYSRVSGLCTSIDDVQRIFKSWYVRDGAEGAAHELFKNAPENVRRQLEREIYYYAPGLLQSYLAGQDVENEVTINPKEMVRDEVTGRNMTREEYSKRELVRLLAGNGWSESRLLNHMSVGSSIERTQQRRSSNKKRKKKRRVSEEDVTSFDTGGIDPMYSEHEDLMSSISNLMRGDD